MRVATIVLQIKVPDESSEDEVRLTLLDTFSEFFHTRRVPEAYVSARYSSDEYSWLDRDEKIAEVRRRGEIALAMKHASFGELAVQVGPPMGEPMNVRNLGCLENMFDAEQERGSPDASTRLFDLPKKGE